MTMNETTTTARPTGESANEMQSCLEPVRPDASREYMTAAQLAEFLNVSEKFVRKHTDAGRLPIVRMGRCIRYRRAEIERRLLSGALLCE